MFLIFTTNQSDTFEKIINDSDFTAERNENSFYFEEENSIDNLEKEIRKIIDKNNISGYFESE